MIASSAPNGSSRHRTRLARQQRAQERDTLAHAAGELVRARAAGSRRAPARRTAPRACSRACARERPAMRSASAALSSALSQGSSRSRWGISTAGGHAIEPASGDCSPQISSSSVLLPQPLGPTTASSSPAPARSETSASACTSSPPALAVAAADVLEHDRRARRRPPAAAARRGLQFGRHFAPFAGITPQVLRVGAGESQFPCAISAGLPASPPGVCSVSARRC